MTATRIVTFLLVVSLLLFAACETDLPPLPDDPPAPGDEGGTNIVGQATSISDERFSEAQFILEPNPAEIPTKISVISNDTIIWSSGYVSIDADEWSEFSLAGERVQNTNWLRAGAQAEIPLDEQTPATENNYAIIYSCNLENNQWNCRENKWQIQQFTTETSCEEGEIVDNQICTDGELIALPGTPEGPGDLGEPRNPFMPDRCTVSTEFSCEDFAVLDTEDTRNVRIELVNKGSETIYFDSFTITDSTGTTQCFGGNDGPGNAGILARPGRTATLSCNIDNDNMESEYVANFTVSYMRGQATFQRISEGSLRVKLRSNNAHLADIDINYPTTVSAGEDFDIEVQLKNNGPGAIGNQNPRMSGFVELLGINPSMFGMTQEDLTKEFTGIVRPGETKTTLFEGLSYQGQNNQPQINQFRARACYEHKALARASLCYPNENDQECNQETAETRGQSGPVQITDVQQSITSTTGRTQLDFTIKHVGQGTVYAPQVSSNPTHTCDTSNEEKDQVSVLVSIQSDAQGNDLRASCPIIGGRDRGTITLREDEVQVRCTIDTNNVEEPLNETVHIASTYMYETHKDAEITINPQQTTPDTCTQGVIGDVTGDGEVTTLDATLLGKIATEQTIYDVKVLVNGEVSSVFMEGETVTVGDQEVTALAIETTSGEVQIRFLVSGETTRVLTKGETQELSTGTEFTVLEVEESELCEACIDVNADGQVNSQDTQRVLAYIANQDVKRVGTCVEETEHYDVEVHQGQLLGQATSQLTKDQLPELLSDGRVVTQEGDTYYTQTLSFNENEGGEIRFLVAGDILVYNEGEQIFTYTLDFTQGLKSDRDGRELEDYQDEEIPFLGEYYNIVKAQYYTDQGLFLTLMRGAISDTLENLFEQQTRTYTLDGNDYTLSPEEFTEENQVRLSINGEITPLLQAGDVYNFEGASIGVRQVITSNHCFEWQGENRGLFNVSPVTESDFLQIELAMAQTENLAFNEQDYEVQGIVTSTRSALVVNGQRTDFLEEGESDEVQGLRVTYVEQTQEAVCREEEARGLVEFYLGAEKIEFRGLQSDENARIYLNGEELVEASAQAQYTARRYYPFDLQSIEYSVEAEPATRNTAYVNEGESLHEHIDNPEALLGLDIIHQGRNSDGTHTVRIQ